MQRKSLNVLIVVMLMAIISACTAKREASVIEIYQDKKLLESVTPEEFLAVFTKNNVSEEKLTKESVEEYLELFINYKLKVKEAEALGMDTLAGFLTELKGYREQLARPYLTDQTVTDRLIEEAWDRMQYDIRASHILFSMPREASPADTLKAFRRAEEAMAKLKAGADFASVAAEFSDDPYAKDIPASESNPGRKGNQGDLGYFTVFDMVYPFENAAYTTRVGHISPIVRSVFGYHILKVTDRKPAMGRVFLAHVYVPHPRTGIPADSAEAFRKITDIYNVWLKGELTFEELARDYSEDRNNAHNGGVLRWFNAHGLVPQFVAALKDMNVNDVSAPIETMYGWHIIKLLNQERPDTLEKELPNIRQRLNRDARAEKSREEAVAKIKGQFGFKEYPGNQPLINAYIDSTLFSGTWIAEKSGILKNKKPLFKIGEETVTIAHFGRWLENRQSRAGSGDLSYLINERYKTFQDDQVIAYKEQRLETLHPEFKALMQEYRDGILLFDLMDRKVWSYAVQDTVGLQAFYEVHKGEHRWDTRVDASVFITKSDSLANVARSMVYAGHTEQEIMDSLNKVSALDLSVRSEKFQTGDHALVDAHPWRVGITQVLPIPAGATGFPGYFFVHYKEVLPPDVKKLQEVRGLMISQYQEQLEKEWLEQLKLKYRVEVFGSELEKLYQ